MSPNYTAFWRQICVLDGQSIGPRLMQIPSKMQMMLFEHLVGMSTVWVTQVHWRRHGIRLDIREGLWMWGILSSY